MISVRTARLMLVTATTVLLATFVAGSADAATATTEGEAAITLARPTGPLPTGTALLHLLDRTRSHPLDPQHRPRELMVQL
jgi:hypothetical protein